MIILSFLNTLSLTHSHVCIFVGQTTNLIAIDFSGLHATVGKLYSSLEVAGDSPEAVC